MKNSEKNQSSLCKTAVSIAIYGMFSTLLLVLFLWLFSVLISKEVISEKLAGVTGIISVFVASLISGLISSKTFGKALLVSAFQGFANFLMYYFMGMLVFMRVIPQNADAYHFIACMVGAIAGGILSAAAKPRRRKIKK